MAHRYALVLGADGRPQQVQPGDSLRTALTLLSDDGAGSGQLGLWFDSDYIDLTAIDGGLRLAGGFEVDFSLYVGSNAYFSDETVLLASDIGGIGHGRIGLWDNTNSVYRSISGANGYLTCDTAFLATNVAGGDVGQAILGGVGGTTGRGRLTLTDTIAAVAHHLSATTGGMVASGTLAASNLSGTNTGDQTSVSGNAGTATALATARALNGVNFDGTADITVPTLVSSVNAGVLRGYIDGLITSRASTTTVTVAAGAARDSTDAHCIYLSAATTKTLQSSGSWAAGTGNNGLDTGARANSTWYHVWAISQAAGASPDVLFSTSATTPTMPSGYTLKRRIGSIRTDGSGNILAYFQYGDQFLWNTPVADISATNPGTSAVTRTLTLPTGVKVEALLSVGFSAGSVGENPAYLYISSLDVADVSPNVSGALTWAAYSASAVVNNSGGQARVWTNTSAQVRSRVLLSSTNTNLHINTNGWIDPRGRDT